MKNTIEFHIAQIAIIATAFLLVGGIAGALIVAHLPMRLRVATTQAIEIVDEDTTGVSYFEWAEPGVFEVRVVPKRERATK